MVDSSRIDDRHAADLADDFDDARRRHGVLGAALAVSINGHVHTAAAGVKSIGGQPITPDTAFQPGSITKMFTAALTMKAFQQGLLQLDDTFAHQADRPKIDHGSRAATITVRHLMAHTSGLWPPAPPNERRWTLADFAQESQFTDTLFAPGSQMSYCNAGYATLGHLLVETAYGKPYADLVVAELIEPAGLHSTVLRTYADAHSAHGHRRLHNDTPLQPWEAGAVDHDWLEPSGSTMWTSAPDLAAFAGLFSTARRRAPHRRILNDTSIAAMLAPQISAHDSAIGDHWGLGVAIFDRGPVRVYGHVGRAPGFTAFLYFTPDPDVVYALMMNEESDAALCFNDECVARYFAPLVSWPPDSTDQRTHVDERRSQDATGVYVGTEFVIRINYESHDSTPTAHLFTADDNTPSTPPWARVHVTDAESVHFFPLDGGRPVAGSLHRQDGSTWLHVFAQAHRKQPTAPP